MSTKKAADIKDGITMFVEFSRIEVNRKWNSRNKYGASVEGEDWKVFQDSFDRGQDTPVILRPLEEPKDGKDFFLVSGHRRLEAIMARGETKGLPSGTIRAEIRLMSWAEARETNVRENAAREGISAADTTYALAQLRKEYKSEGREPGQVEIATALGLQQGYISRLTKVIKSFDESDINMWRASQKAVSLTDVETIIKKHPADADKDKRKEQFRALFGGANGEGDGEENGGGTTKTWLDRAISKAEDTGQKLAAFEFAGFCEPTKKAWDVENVGFFTSASNVETATEKQLARIMSKGEASYEKTLKNLTEQAEKEAAEEAAAAEKEAKAAKEAAKNAKGKGKGAEASAN